MGLSSAARAPGAMAGNQLNATAIAAATRVAFPRPMSTMSTPNRAQRAIGACDFPRRSNAGVGRSVLSLTCPLRGVSHHLESVVQLRLGLGNILADAGKRFHHRRLLAGRQGDQLAAVVGP